MEYAVAARFAKFLIKIPHSIPGWTPVMGVVVETSARISSGTQEISAPKSVNEDKRYLQKILSIEDTEGKTWEAKSRRRALKSPPSPPIPGGIQLPHRRQTRIQRIESNSPNVRHSNLAQIYHQPFLD